jgi:hypothetical protein
LAFDFAATWGFTPALALDLAFVFRVMTSSASAEFPTSIQQQPPSPVLYS